jgi:hypothetical protein
VRYWKVTPEVPAELGEETKLDTTVHPPVVNALHLRFVGWSGSEFIECFPVYAATRGLAHDLAGAGLTGFQVVDLKLTRDEQFHDLYPCRELPDFVWLKIGGGARFDDFGMDADHKVVVSDRALAILKSRSLVNCEVDPA